MTGFFEDHLNLDAVVAYADGELSLVAFQRAAAHVLSCPRCAAEVDEQAFARVSLRSAASPVMPSSLTAALCSIPVASPAAGRPPGIGVDSRSGHAIRISHAERGVTRSRRLRLGAGALVAGIAVSAFATGAASTDEPGNAPGGHPSMLPAAYSPSGAPTYPTVPVVPTAPGR
ncbi:MAG: hypothetical protein ABIR83_06110 [Nakamurella sp.]